MDAAEIEELKKLCAEAAPGPCIVSCNATTGEHTLDTLRRDGMGEVVHRYAWSRSLADIRLDAAARTAIPKLIEDLETEREKVARLRGALEEVRRDAQCSCSKDYTRRGLHEPNALCYLSDVAKAVLAVIERKL